MQVQLTFMDAQGKGRKKTLNNVNRCWSVGWIGYNKLW